MNAEKLMKVIGEAQEGYIESAMETRGQNRKRRTLRLGTKMVLVAAILLSLATTVYASNGMEIKSLLSLGWDKYYSSFQKLDAAMEKAGFQMDARETFDNGYVFDDMAVYTIQGLDDDQNRLLTYKSIHIDYKNPVGHRISVSAEPHMASIAQSPTPVKETRQMGEICVAYLESCYRFLPAEKEGNLTEEELLWEQQPGNYISYGSTTDPAGFQAYESIAKQLRWEKEGICYLITDLDGTETAESLFAMAEALIGES